MTRSGKERVDLPWLRQHEDALREASSRVPFWRNTSASLTLGGRQTLSDFLRRLDELGYERTQTVSRPGECAQRGGVVEVFPFNRLAIYRVEFYGNTVAAIETLDQKVHLAGERRRLAARRLDLSLLDTLKPGDYLVHLDHGIGVFTGFSDGKENPVGDAPAAKDRSILKRERYFVIGYAKEDRLYVPESQKDKLSLYVGLRVPQINRLGSSASWLRARRAATESTLRFARQLLELYAVRELEKGFAFPGDDAMQLAFESTFPYEETLDQRIATDEIKRDMEQPRPMERLLAGDVGFGKTEVAMRAAFKAAGAGKQVALLAPTTVLAYQHFRSFSERMRNFPVRIALLSRLELPGELQGSAAEVLADVAGGGVDIVIGTHRLLSKDVSFRDLGLLIIDEEQKFGVAQKEKLKTLKANIDVLLLSATPIPRTLSLALSSLRQMSVIETPPPGRMPIVTAVVPYSDEVIRQAIAKELERGGQVYLLWNRVETIALATRKVAALAPPGTRLAMAHGRMGEAELIETMERFRKRTTDVLVATTIIENGLDFDNVNTLIVANATRLGLAQAHQVRGRIGRGEREAYAYFLHPERKLTGRAKARMEALEEFSQLGSGYRIALRDLEIRGAGNLLGKEQSGNIQRLGLNLYLAMLAEAVEGLRQER